MPEFLTITSPQNERLKRAVKLRDRKGRKQQQRTILDGLRETHLALESDWEVQELFCRASKLDDQAVRTLAERASERGASTLSVADSAFDKLAFGNRDEGVVATTAVPNASLDELRLPADPLICVLDRIEKPGNIGAALRTANAAGVDAVVLSDPQTDPFNPNAIRASLGAIFRTALAAGSADAVRLWLRQQAVRILAARVDGPRRYDEPLFGGGVAVVLGSESQGLDDSWSAADVTGLTIPMRGEVDSLNVSATAAVLLFEAVRQRRSNDESASPREW